MNIQPKLARRAIAAAGIACVAALSLTNPAVAQNRPAQAGPVKVLVIDRQALLRVSKVGQDIARQVQDLKKSAETELKGEGEALQREKVALEQNDAIYAADVRAQKRKAFESKAIAFQQKLRMRTMQIQYGVMLAQRQVSNVAGPVVEGIMKEQGANLMIDRQAVVIGAPGLDVTQLAIDRLNQKLPAVKIQLATPPPDVMQQMLAQQQ